MVTKTRRSNEVAPRAALSLVVHRLSVGRLERLRDRLLRGYRVLCGSPRVHDGFVWNGYADPLALAILPKVPVWAWGLTETDLAILSAMLQLANEDVSGSYRLALERLTHDEVVEVVQEECSLRGVPWSYAFQEKETVSRGKTSSDRTNWKRKAPLVEAESDDE